MAAAPPGRFSRDATGAAVALVVRAVFAVLVLFAVFVVFVAVVLAAEAEALARAGGPDFRGALFPLGGRLVAMRAPHRQDRELPHEGSALSSGTMGRGGSAGALGGFDQQGPAVSLREASREAG